MYTLHKVTGRGPSLRPSTTLLMKVPNWSVDEAAYMLNNHTLWFVREERYGKQGPIVYGCPLTKKIFLCEHMPNQTLNVFQCVSLSPWDKDRDAFISMLLQGTLLGGWAINILTTYKHGPGKYLMGTLLDTGVMNFPV